MKLNPLPTPRCNGCGKEPHELECYTELAMEEGLTPEEYVRRNEGTYNPVNGHFMCDDCYLAAGAPAVKWPGPNWIAP